MIARIRISCVVQRAKLDDRPRQKTNTRPAILTTQMRMYTTRFAVVDSWNGAPAIQLLGNIFSSSVEVILQQTQNRSAQRECICLP
jgi:hypothetical protein